VTDRAALDWLNFLLADVKDGLGPFLAIYLMGTRHWDATEIGAVMTIGGMATVLARAPAGALVDAATMKRGLVVGAALVVALGTLAFGAFPAFWTVAATQVAIGGCDAVFPPAVAAITLGLVGRSSFTRRVGRNEAFNHAGNAVSAIAAGLAGWLVAPAAMLWLVAALALACCIVALAIDPSRIDHRLARGADDHDPARRASGIAAILSCRPLLLFTAAITLFHFANAAMLPLLGERLARTHEQAGPLFMAACIVTAQLVMVPMSMLVGRKADTWGRKPLFLAGFAALPVRGVLYTLVGGDPVALISIQLLDGIGAGIFGALFFIVIADLTQGTGRYNLALGGASAAWGCGAALSNSVAGFIADRMGYDAAFLFLAAVAVIALVVFWVAVPETSRPASRRAAGARVAAAGE